MLSEFFYCEIKWQRLSYPKTCLLLILPPPDSEMESLHSPAAQQGLWGAGKECRLRGPCVASKAIAACGMRQLTKKRSPLAFHRSQRSSLSVTVFLGKKNPVPFSEHKEVPSRLVAPKESRDDMVWDTNS